MAAAVRLLREGGFAQLTMERIAERAGVSKAALYRRWPNKVSLLADAILDFASTVVAVPDTGSLAGDIVELMTGFLKKRRQEAETIEALVAAVASSRELAERCAGKVFVNFRSVFRAVVERAVARGELPEETDVELLGDLAPALVRYRRQVSGTLTDEAYIHRIAKQFFTTRSEGTNLGITA